MGIFDAMTTAVSGLKAQSYSLENISGNIANSQTTAYKRVDTSFSDIVASIGQAANHQPAGSVIALSRPTNTIQGPVEASNTDTHMAINGDGYFQVQKKVSESDGAAVFSGADMYTRRGDYTMDREGYLVNGAGYYLKAVPLDPKTGNPVGGIAKVIQLSTGFLPAQLTTEINYNANLPSNPRVGMVVPSDYAINPTLLPASSTPALPAALTGSTDFTTIDLTNNADNQYSFHVNGTAITLTQADSGGDNLIDQTEAIAAINTQLSAASVPVTAAPGTGVNANKIVFTTTATGSGAVVTIDTIAKTGTGNLANIADLGFGSTGGSATGVAATSTTAGQGFVAANDFTTFRSQSLDGGSTTAYDAKGTPLNVQLRWAKLSTGPDKWNLFYQSNSTATGANPMWTNAGVDFQFDTAGKLTTPLTKITFPSLTVDGTTLGAVDFKYGTNGLTQYATPQGNVDVTTIQQNGIAPGSLVGIGVSDNGRITANYSNGQQIDVAEVPLYSFNGDNALKRLEGGAFAETRESGSATRSTNGSIKGQALEGSNTDIADEFSKMIVTQQAYSANSKIISTANQMLQDVINIIR